MNIILLLSTSILFNFITPRLDLNPKAIPDYACTVFSEETSFTLPSNISPIGLTYEELEKNLIGFKAKIIIDVPDDQTVTTYKIISKNGYFDNQPEKTESDILPIGSSTIYTLNYNVLWDTITVACYNAANEMVYADIYSPIDTSLNKYKILHYAPWEQQLIK